MQRLFLIWWKGFEFDFIVQASNQAKDQGVISASVKKSDELAVPNVSQILYK